jgi:type IV pilus assembly protein PilY1
MMHKHMLHKNFYPCVLGTALALAFSAGARAQSQDLNDDFTQASDTNSWVTFDGACLTAGDGTGSIPSCKGLKYYAGQIQVGGDSGFLGQKSAPASGNVEAPDPVGKGALRFTNGYTSGKGGFANGYNQAGSIISSGTPFSNAAGLSVIFKTVTYRGDKGNGDGADGMGFFLMDGSLSPYDTGAFGGSLGYTCSNSNNDSALRADGTVRGYDGLVGGYLGLGIDEFGNFLNAGDNTATGPSQTPGRIGLRGNGSISWAWLTANYPKYYPPALLTIADGTTYITKAMHAVHDTCHDGVLWDYSNPSNPKKTAIAAPDYAVIPGASVVLSTLLPGKNISNISATTRNDATPITYNLKITQDGILSLYISYNGGTYLPVIAKQKITSSNGPLPSTFRFGFTGSTGGSTNIHEIMCFQAGPADLAGTSVGINQQEATKIASGTQAYIAYYYPANWTGRLTASDLLYDTSTQSLSIAAAANWDAQCNLTGVATGTCPTTGASAVIAAQAPTSRTMLTWSGSQGEAFEWNAGSGGALTSGQKSTIDQGDITPINANRLNYLRGDRTNEIDTSGVGLFRPRDGVLGDIIDSSPTWVGPPASPYVTTWQDLLVTTDPTPENSGSQSYAQFLTTEQTRLNVVYTGANDGFLHGFRSGSFSSTGVYVNNSTTPNDGREVLAYMPAAVLQTIHNATNGTLDYSGSQYSHNFYVDATPEADELFYNGVWHTWLVGGLGAGGPAIYALDITDPTTFSEGNASTLVKGEWSASTISCGNAGGCASSLGNTYGTPVIRRLHDGKWGIIFGNGFGSASGDAGIFILVLDSSTGGTTTANTYYLGTGVSGSNGIAYVAPADLDGDHITDYVYAGDLLGNVWRFDLTSATESSWSVTKNSGGTPAPLFTTAAGQPITSKLLVTVTPKTAGAQRVLIDFGTGRKFPQSVTVPASFASGAQSLYGIWDWNMANWNSRSSLQLASLAAPQTVTVSTLQSQTLTSAANATLDVTANPVCWTGSTTCTSGNTQFGWKVALPGAGEQVIYNPIIYGNAFILNTTIPAANSPTSCQVLHDTGNTIALAASTGGASGIFKNTTDTGVAGQQTNGTGQVSIIQAGGNTMLMTQTLGDAPPPPPGGPGGPISCPPGQICWSALNGSTNAAWRLSWTERR